MAKRYIIDDIRANNWIVRMRDRETGEVVEVPLELGALWPGKLRGDAVPREPGEPPTPRGDLTEAPPPDDASPASDDPAVAPTIVDPPVEKKPRKRAVARAADPEPVKENMATPRSEDESAVATEEVEEPRTLPQTMRRANRARKVGELGWSETTDDGRSGLVSRFGAGVYKILHAGGDTYALFFEWDDGRYDKLGCGAAEAMMTLANYKAKEEPPEPPPSHISLEMARFVCATAEQKLSPRERLELAIAEAAGKTPKVVAAPASKTPKVVAAPAESVDDELRRSLVRENARFQARQEQKRRAEAPPDPIVPNAAMDQQLTDSLKRALADLDAADTNERKGE